MPQHRAGQAVQVFLELPAQPRLADTGGSGDDDQPRRAAFGGGVEQLLDQAQFGVASEHRRFEAVDALRPTDPGEHAIGRPQPQRLGLALELVLTAIGETDGGSA